MSGTLVLMGVGLYLVAAVVVAITAWLVSSRFGSYDAPGDVARAFWSVAAGALWPLVLVGAAQLLAVRCVARRLRPAHAEEVDLAALVAVPDGSLRP